MSHSTPVLPPRLSVSNQNSDCKGSAEQITPGVSARIQHKPRLYALLFATKRARNGGVKAAGFRQPVLLKFQMN